MGGTMKKGAHGNIHAAYSSSSSRRKWSNVYVVMVVVCSVFGCLILGLMGIHRLRERTSLNLLLKEKDDQILSLHHLLQKERGQVEQVKRKTDEMKAKIMNLGSEKADLNSRISELQSTISSLREEQRTVESAFQEKYTQVNDRSPQLEALKDELRQKEGEIEDLKRRLQLHGEDVRSVSENQPANATTEASAKESEAKKEESASGENESSTTSTETIQTGSENGGTSVGDEVETKSEKEREYLGKEEHTESQTQSSDNQVEGIVHQGWKNMENEEDTRRFRGRRGYLRRAKGKRWRSTGEHIEGKRTPPSNEASTMADPGSLTARSNPEDNSQSQGIEDLRREALRNSSLEKTHSSLEELAKNSAMRMDGVKHTEETEHLEEQISIRKPTEDETEKQDTGLLQRKEASGRNGEEQDALLSRDSEESEDREETEEPEF